MKLELLKTTSIILFLVGNSSCTKNEKPNDPINPLNGDGVYVAYTNGYQYNSRDAILWHNDKEIVLNDNYTSIYVNDMAIAANGDIYTTGCECWTSRSNALEVLNDSCFLILWKNGLKQELTKSPLSYFSDAFISITKSGDQYIVGTEESSSFNKLGIIRLWKNGVSQNITDGSQDANAYCLFATDNDVYIGGSLQPNSSSGLSTAVLWKNGMPEVLKGGTKNSRVASVKVSGTDVYAAVVLTSGDSAWVFKNGILQSFPNTYRYIEDIFVSENDLYVLGIRTSYSKSVWKNGSLLYDLDYPESNAIKGQRLFVKDKDIYVSGTATTTKGEFGVVWKNRFVLNTISQPSPITSVDALVVK